MNPGSRHFPVAAARPSAAHQLRLARSVTRPRRRVRGPGLQLVGRVPSRGGPPLDMAPANPFARYPADAHGGAPTFLSASPCEPAPRRQKCRRSAMGAIRWSAGFQPAGDDPARQAGWKPALRLAVRQSAQAGTTPTAERRPSCRPVCANRHHADKNVGAPLWALRLAPTISD
jgi:hypothetical protein